MGEHVGTTARAIARHWAEGMNRSPAAVRGLARQVQDHLDHGGDPDHLRHLVGFMAIEHPTCIDLDMAMRYAGAPRPQVPAQSPNACPCRGGATRGGGAPAPPDIRQLIRSHAVAA
ncbi:hypothetical protein F3K34_44320 [Streptomyces sp. LBUM 1486]|uniref:hypothetical protein n=1 Tax=Streptomyces scabiei TaxID=1930 RepID=UPI001B32ED4A|nr:hypothetical protein [Streptomyces sp. LBUM 1486]MBP5918806.1 hypothetical protein [Streptomyces sp. LBUM 1486]